jgi:vacuolar-type H+-ATPase subunit I/STV1
MKIKENDELKDFAPSISGEDFEKLKKSIREKGQQESLHLMANGTLIDGYHRLLALKQLQREPKTIIHPEITTIQQAKELSRILNGTRRHMNPYQRIVMDLKSFTSETFEQIAMKTGRSEGTLSKVKKIMDEAPEALKKKLDEGEIGYHKVYDYLTTLDQIPEDKRKPFTDELKEGKVETSNIKKVYEHSLEAEETLNDYNELVQSQVKPNFEKELYTPEFDDKRLKQLQHDLLVASGGNPKLVTKFIETSEFGNDDTKAQAYAKKMGGRYVGKVQKGFYEIEIDPLKEG